MTDNWANNGAGVYCEGGNPRVRNSLIARNTGGRATGVYVYGSAQVTGCTVVANRADNTAGGTLGATLQNCIVWGNQPNQLDSSAAQYCDIQGGWYGTGNIDEDPLFADPNNGDYRLQAGSPCVDRGNPGFVATPGELDLAGAMRVWNGDAQGGAVVDMGAYEFGSFRYGDLNCDARVDFGDINPFVLALTDPGAYALAYPACERDLADVNGDGAVNFGDINPFVAVLGG